MDQDRSNEIKHEQKETKSNAENIGNTGKAFAPPPLNLVQKKKDDSDNESEEQKQSNSEIKEITSSGESPADPGQNDSISQAFQLKVDANEPTSDSNLSKTSSPGPLGPTVQTKMEDAFGYDFSNINIHKNSGKASEIGAKAFTQGTDVHFAPGQFKPDSKSGQELIGHELSHVVQQQQNVKPTVQRKGVSINDDPKLEAEADRMGVKAAAGGSTGNSGSKALQMRSSLRAVQAKSKPIQMAEEKSNWGKFKDVGYTVNKNLNRAEIKVEFEPGDRINAPKIGMTQAIKSYIKGNAVTIDPSQKNRLAEGADSAGYQTDRISPRTNPIYGSPDLAAGKELKDTKTTNKTKTSSGTYGLGWRYWKNRKLHKQKAWLWDRPTMGDGGHKNSGQIFETTAVALDGPMKGTYFGSVQWGWQRDASNNFSKVPFKILSKGVPTSKFMDSAAKWNTGTQRGTVKTNAKTKFLINKLTDKTTIAKGIKVSIVSPVSWGGDSFYKVNPLEGTHKGKTGYIPNAHLTDQGDGAATTDLPLTKSKTINAQGVWLVRQPRRYRETIIKKLPKKTKVQVLKEGRNWNKVIVDGGIYTGRVGWVMKNYLE